MTEQAENNPGEAVGATERLQGLGEEIANSVTHGIGAALGVAALVILVVLTSLRGDAWRIVGVSIYGASLINLYLASTLYHGLPGSGAKRFFQLMDHCSIYVLIAGSYTPVILGLMRDAWGWSILVAVWVLAAVGIGIHLFVNRKSEKTALALYIAMGWLCLVAIVPMLQTLPGGLLLWLVLGGVCYTLGVVLFCLKQVPYAHAAWHLFVLAGSTCHFFGILLYVA